MSGGTELLECRDRRLGDCEGLIEYRAGLPGSYSKAYCRKHYDLRLTKFREANAAWNARRERGGA